MTQATDSDAPTVESAETRVARGLEWLRTEGGKYDLDVRRVDLDNLSIISASQCVLAMATGIDAGGYHRAVDRIYGEDRYDTEATVWARAHGFLPLAWSEDDAAAVEDAWHAALGVRDPAEVDSVTEQLSPDAAQVGG